MKVCHLFSELADKQSITALFTIPDKQRGRDSEELVWAILKPGTLLRANEAPPPLSLSLREVLLLAISFWLLPRNKIWCGCTISLVPSDLVGIRGFFCLPELLEHIKVAQAVAALPGTK